MQSRIVKRFLMFFIVFHLIPASGAQAAGWTARAEIREFSITRGKDYVYIDAKLKGAFTDGINEAIASGIPTTFRYYLELVIPRPLFMDKKPAKRVIQHKVAYDTLKKEYQVILDDGFSSQVRVTKDEEQMKKWMSSLVSVRFLPSQELSLSEEKYLIRLKAEMKCIKMPFPLNYLLYYLISFLDFDTPWITLPIPAAVSDTSAMSWRIWARQP
ncbi:MAG: DUF4390 domain-containing protein [bacterium]